MQAARAERGTKRTCLNCGERFYDLSRDPIICPVCEHAHAPTAFVRQRPQTPVVEVKPKPIPQIDDADDLKIAGVELDDDEDLIEDTDDLAEDDTDVDVAVDVDDEEEER